MKRFRGVLCPIGKASSKFPMVQGIYQPHPILVPREFVPSLRKLVGKPLKYQKNAGHFNARNIGVIDRVYIHGESVVIEGELHKRLRAPAKCLGLSFTLSDCIVAGVRDRVWSLQSANPSSVLLARNHKVAFGTDTSFEVVK